MSLFDFLDNLVSAIESAPVPTAIMNEKAFETRFLMPVLLEISAQHPDVRTYTHPWGNKVRCVPDCDIAPNRGRVVAGCPRCWATSKKWSSVFAFGTHHTFDAAARSGSGKTVAIEIKLISAKGGRMPNGEIQRMIGQCALAKTKHDFVVGVCGYRGIPEQGWNGDTEPVKAWFQRAGIRLIFRSVT